MLGVNYEKSHFILGIYTERSGHNKCFGLLDGTTNRFEVH